MSVPALAIPQLELLDEIGRGATSVVVRACRDGQMYAAKLPLSAGNAGSSPALVERFRREAIALARVQHRGLPQVMEVGETRGTPYIVMELVVGETLHERRGSRRLPEVEVVDLAIQVAGVLEAVHGVGLVHRDVKPSNILFDARNAHVRLVDFGFVAEAERSVSTVAGTPAYAAPEARRQGRVDGRADLYSLGGVLYECLSGRLPPRAGERDEERSVNVRDDLREVSDELAAVVQRLLALDPDDRYPDATALLSDLGRIREGEAPERSPSPSVFPPTQHGAPLFVGRRKELEALRRAASDARTRERTVFLTGPSGVGKSRLARELADEFVRSEQLVLTAHCRRDDPRPLVAIRQLLEGFLHRGRGRGTAETEEAAAHLRAIAGDLAPLVRVLSPRLSEAMRTSVAPPGAETAYQFFVDGLAELLSKLSSDGGLILIDDAQWLDVSSQRVLKRAADRRSEGGALHLLVLRDDTEGQSRRRELEEALGSSTVHLQCPALSDEEVVQIVQGYLGHAELAQDVVHQVSALCDGTPLGALEVVRALLDAGALRPHWGGWCLEPNVASQLDLPPGARAVLSQRIQRLDPATRTTLTEAAVLGPRVDDDLLVAISHLPEDQVHAALSEGRAAALIDAEPHARHRFVHDATRERLLASLDSSERSELHHRVAEALDNRDSAGTPDETYRVAWHYARGVARRSPSRVLATNLDAARLAFETFDSVRALGFFSAAETAAHELDRELDVADQVTFAEAELRAGAFDRARVRFENALALIDDPLRRARIESRIAWMHESTFDAAQAWPALERSFTTLGLRLPRPNPVAALVGMVWWWFLGRFLARRSAVAAERERLDLTCSLYHQAARLSFQCGEGVRFLRITFLALCVAPRLGPSTALVRARHGLAMVCVLFGMRRTGMRVMTETEAIAAEVGDPVLRAYCRQIRSVLCSWAGDHESTVRISLQLIEEHGHWRDVSEYCLNAVNVQVIENTCGRPRVAWRAAALAARRASEPDVSPRVARLSLLGAVATLHALGREDEARTIQRRLQDSEPLPNASALVVFSYGPRLRCFTEQGDLGEEFEALVREVDAGRHDPQRVHLIMSDYYLNLAHARVHGCLRADPSEWPKLIPTLRQAISDFERAARIPLLRAHVSVLRAYLSWFMGRSRAADRLFTVAEAQAQRQQVPWVLYAVHRGRAHMLRSQGAEAGATDQALIAATIARTYGTAHRLRWIQEEFDLRKTGNEETTESMIVSISDRMDAGSSGSTSSASSIVAAPLDSVMHMTQVASGDTDADRQAKHVLDDVVQALRAARGMLYLCERENGRPNDRSSSPEPDLVAARDAHQSDLDNIAVDSDILRSVMSGRTTQAFKVESGSPFAGSHLLAAPLLLGREALGCVVLQRDDTATEFTTEDAERLGAMAAQIPLAFELVRGLGTRDRVVRQEHEVQKMEALGRLAGGVAHDLNNLFFIIQSASTTLERMGNFPPRAADHLQLIQDTTGRATELVRHLMAVSRGQRLDPEVCSLVDLCGRAEPALRKTLGPNHRIQFGLAEDTPLVKIDRVQMERVLINLVANARDAMPDGGAVVVGTSLRLVDEMTAFLHRHIVAGPFAVLSVEDTGMGIPPDVLQRMFEPFFTTKRDRGGTGLGLATTWGIVNQSGGFIEVDSAVGKGTTFRIHLPKTLDAPPSSGAAPASPVRKETILLVQPDGALRNSLDCSLQSLGYHVYAADSARTALDIATAKLDGIDLMITDVIIDDINGLELTRTLRRSRPSLRVMFVSGTKAESLAHHGIVGGKMEHLQTPVDAHRLAQSVRDALDESDD